MLLAKERGKRRGGGSSEKLKIEFLLGEREARGGGAYILSLGRKGVKPDAPSRSMIYRFPNQPATPNSNSSPPPTRPFPHTFSLVLTHSYSPDKLCLWETRRGSPRRFYPTYEKLFLLPRSLGLLI